MSGNNDKQNLPKFISEGSNTSYNEEQPSWLANNLHRLMIWVSLGWFSIVFIYITQFFGWSNLFLMMPDEFGGFLAGVTLPLAIIWVVMAYIDRGTSFKNEAKFLRAYMNQLVYPEDGGAQTAKAMADAIRSQVIELQEATRLATVQTEKIKQELGGRIDDFSRLVNVLDTYSSKTIVELTDGVRTLMNNFESMTTKASNTSEDFKEYIIDFSNTANVIQKDMNNLMGTLLPSIQEMRNTTGLLKNVSDENAVKIAQAQENLINYAEQANESMSQVSRVLAGQTQHLENLSHSAVESCNSMYKNLEGGVSKIDKSIKEQSKSVLEYVNILDKKSEELGKHFMKHREEISVEVDKVVARANVIDESISMQVRELSGVSDDIYNSLKQVEDNIEEQIHNLERKSEVAIAEISNVVNLLEDSTEKVSTLSDQSVSKTNDLVDVIDNKHKVLIQVADTLRENLNILGLELTNKIENTKTQSEEIIESFNSVGNNLKRNSESMIEASSIVVSQSKISEASLAQQQRHITSSINKIEEIKADIKRQLDELSRAASVIDEESTQAIKRMQSQMEEVLKSSDSVVNKTKVITDNLASQASNFDESTNKTLIKVSKFEDTLDTHYKKLDDISKTIEKRANYISDTISRQTSLVDKTTSDSTNTFNNILGAFESQSTLLNSVAENTVGYVSDVVQALDEKAAAINLLFKQQENEFLNVCERLEENTNNIGGNLKKQISSIEQSADRVFARMSVLEDDITKRSDNVIESTNKSIDKLNEVSVAINDKNSEINRTAVDVSEKLNMISEGFKANVSNFSNIVKEVREETNLATTLISSNGDKVKGINSELVSDTKNTSSVLDNHIKNMESVLVRTKTQADTIKETLEAQKDNLTDIANVLVTQTRLGETSLAQQYKYLSDTAIEVSQKMNEINSKFKENTDNVFDVSNKLSYEFDVLGDKLIKVGEDISKSSKSSIKNVEQVSLSLGNTLEDVNSAAHVSTNKVKEIIKEYENYIANFHTTTAEASTGVIEINTLISSQSDKMLAISEGTKELVECFNTILNDTSVQLSNRANDAYNKVKGLGENLKALSMQLDEATKLSATHFEKSGDKLRATLTEITSNAERISNDIRSSGEVFLKQSAVLVSAGDDTLQKVSDVMGTLISTTNDFNKQGDAIVKKSSEFNNMFSKQYTTLEEISLKADKKLKQLEHDYSEIKIDSFLKDAGSIIEKLETVAVDINRIFNPKTEEDLWKRYYQGDTSAFIRHLAKTMTKQQAQAVREMFEKNLDFRTIVTRYLSEFEILVSKAKSNERSNILLSVISGADIGKLYYILAKSLDKIN